MIKKEYMEMMDLYGITYSSNVKSSKLKKTLRRRKIPSYPRATTNKKIKYRELSSFIKKEDNCSSKPDNILSEIINIEQKETKINKIITKNYIKEHKYILNFFYNLIFIVFLFFTNENIPEFYKNIQFTNSGETILSISLFYLCLPFFLLFTFNLLKYFIKSLKIQKTIRELIMKKNQLEFNKKEALDKIEINSENVLVILDSKISNSEKQKFITSFKNSKNINDKDLIKRYIENEKNIENEIENY